MPCASVSTLLPQLPIHPQCCFQPYAPALNSLKEQPIYPQAIRPLLALSPSLPTLDSIFEHINRYPISTQFPCLLFVPFPHKQPHTGSTQSPVILARVYPECALSLFSYAPALLAECCMQRCLPCASCLALGPQFLKPSAGTSYCQLVPVTVTAC